MESPLITERQLPPMVDQTNKLKIISTKIAGEVDKAQAIRWPNTITRCRIVATLSFRGIYEWVSPPISWRSLWWLLWATQVSSIERPLEQITTISQKKTAIIINTATANSNNSSTSKCYKIKISKGINIIIINNRHRHSIISKLPHHKLILRLSQPPHLSPHATIRSQQINSKTFQSLQPTKFLFHSAVKCYHRNSPPQHQLSNNRKPNNLLNRPSSSNKIVLNSDNNRLSHREVRKDRSTSLLVSHIAPSLISRNSSCSNSRLQWACPVPLKALAKCHHSNRPSYKLRARDNLSYSNNIPSRNISRWSIMLPLQCRVTLWEILVETALPPNSTSTSSSRFSFHTSKRKSQRSISIGLEASNAKL